MTSEVTPTLTPAANNFIRSTLREGLQVPKKKAHSRLEIRRRACGLRLIFVYFFSAMAAAVADFPAAIGIIACSYGVPDHII